MARIPVGSFGQSGPPRPQGGSARNPGSEDMAALGQAARAIGGIATQFVQKQQDDDAALARAKATNALLDHELAVKARADDVASRVATGELDYTAADAFYQEEVAKVEAPKTDGLDPVLAEQMQGGLRRNQEAARQTVSRVIGQAKRADFKGQFFNALDTLGKLAGAPDADVDTINAKAEAFSALARQAEIPPDQVAKTLQDFKDKNWTNHATQRFINTRDDLEGLNQLETDLTAEDGYYASRLDTDRRNALLAQVTAGKMRLENKTAIETDKREAIAEREVTWFSDQMVTGVEITGERWAQGWEAVQGTSQEAAFQEARSLATEIQSFRAAPFADQEAFLQREEASFKSSPSADPKKGMTRLNTLRAAFDEGKKLAAESPLLYYQHQTGQQVPPLDLQAMASGDIDGVAAQLQSRFAINGALRKRYGSQIGMSPWLPQEAAMAKDFFAQADDKGRLAVLSALSAGTPDAASFVATLKPLAADEPLFMAAGLAQYRELKGPGGENVPALILNGARILEDKSTVMPADSEFVRVFDESVGTALAAGSAERQTAFEVFKALYAGHAAKTANLHTEYQGKVYAKDELVEAAIAMGVGNIATVGGEKVVIPYGMDTNDFEQRVQSELRRASEASGFDLDAMEDMPLVPADEEGAYYLVNGGAIQTNPKTREPIIVRVK